MKHEELSINKQVPHIVKRIRKIVVSVELCKEIKKDVLLSCREWKSPWGIKPQTFGFCALTLYHWTKEPLPKQKYGNGMGLLGPYLTHRWEWYGKVTWVYGIGMGPNFTKFLTMGHAWEENRRLLILWETYGNKVPIHIPYQ